MNINELVNDFVDHSHSYGTYDKIHDVISISAEVIEKNLYDHINSLDKKNSYVQVLLGLLYCHGYHVKKDYIEAMKWYQLSAAQNNSYGQYQLAYLYLYEPTIENDWTKGFELCTLSAKQNNADGLYGLAILYEKGHKNSPKDIINYNNYLRYMILATKAGHKEAVAAKPKLFNDDKCINAIIKLFERVDELIKINADHKAKIEEQASYIKQLELISNGSEYTEAKENKDLTVIDGKKLMI